MNHSEEQNDNFETAAIQRLIDVRLKARWRETSSVTTGEHPDDDAINAFVEGQLSEEESSRITAHLITCASCLHLTAQLIRFEPEMDEVGSASAPDQGPGPLQRFFDRLAAGVTPSVGEDAVFAYNEHDDPENKRPESDPQKREPESD